MLRLYKIGDFLRLENKKDKKRLSCLRIIFLRKKILTIRIKTFINRLLKNLHLQIMLIRSIIKKELSNLFSKDLRDLKNIIKKNSQI